MTASTATTNRTVIRNPFNDELVARLLQRVTVTNKSKTVAISAPSAGQELARTPVGTQVDVNEVFKCVRAAQKRRARMTPEKRDKVLHRFHDLLFTHYDQVLDLLQAETGKNRASAHRELVHTAITARCYGNQGSKLLEPERARGAVPVPFKTTAYHHPKGAVDVITSWSYLLILTVSDALAALMAGNAIVPKSDGTTPLTTLFAVNLLHRAGLLEDLFQIIPSPGRVVGQGIVGQCDLPMFAGSSETGRSLAQQCGERLISFSVGSGGEDPLIVAEDTNINRAVEGTCIGCFTNSGHLCVSIERIYVMDSVWDEFVPAFIGRVKAMSIDAGCGWETKMGRLQSQGQFDTIKSMVDETIEAGATVLAGGRPRPDLGPLSYEPTVFTGTPGDVALLTGEVFDPVVVFQRVSDIHDAVAKSNDPRYGLNALLWTSPHRARELAPQLEAGIVNVSDGFTAAFASIGAPMGGFEDSGVDRRQAADGLLKYTDRQTVTVQHLSPVSIPQMLRELYSKVFNTALVLGKEFNAPP